MPSPKKLSLSSLLLNTENYRFKPVASQKEAISQMIEDQKENLYNVAEHILKFGPNPHEEVIVTPSTEVANKFVVLEGNRRVTALKLLNNPDLIESSAFSNLKKRFKKSHDTNTDLIEKLIKSIECSVYDDPKDADVWIGLKHGFGPAGVFTDRWESVQKQRFTEKTEGKTSTSLQIIELLRNAETVPDDLKEKLDKINTTNLDRLISDPAVRAHFGIEIQSGIIQSDLEQGEVVKGLTEIVKRITAPKFKVDDIYLKKDREAFLKKFHKSALPDHSKLAERPWQFTNPSKPLSSSGSTPLIVPKTKPNPKDRKTLIPKTTVITISNNKINQMYYELKGCKLEDYKNIIACSLRVFVELSLDAYWDEHIAKTGQSAASDAGDFIQKGNRVCEDLNKNKSVDNTILNPFKTLIKSKNDILGLTSWHAYIHNHRFAAKPGDLTTTWDAIQEFIITLWSNIK